MKTSHILAGFTATLACICASAAAASPSFSFDSLPGLSTTQEPRCKRGDVAYYLDWRAYMAHERSATGEPTRAFAISTQGPDLPVIMRFDGDTDRFTFDSPRIEGPGLGSLVLRQDLANTDQFTLTELFFDGPVRDLTLRIEDFDAHNTYSQGVTDLLRITASRPGRHHDILPVVYTEKERTPVRNAARRALRERMGRPESIYITPIGTNGYAGSDYMNITAGFPDLVDRISIGFFAGSIDPLDQIVTWNPTPQSIVLGDLSFCVRPSDR
jgi:hypothetical protein